MLEYFILTIYVLLISLFKFKNRKLQLFLCFFPFFLFIATRIGWTADYYNYESMFLEQHFWSWRDYIFFSFNKFEPGFFLLIKSLPSYRALLIFISLFYTSAIFLVFYKYIPRKYYFLAFVLWFYNPTFFESFAAVRSSIVIAFFIFATHLKINGRILYSIILILISGFFHKSGFLLLPFILIPIEFIKKHFFKISLSIFILFLIIILSPSLIVEKINEYLTDSQFSSYSSYLNYADSYGLGYMLFTTLRIVFISYFLFLIKKNIIVEKYLWFVLIMFFYYILSSIPNIQIAYRFNVYLNPFIIVLQIYVLSRDKSVFSKIYISLTLFYMFYYFSTFFNHPNYIPYFLNYDSSLLK